MSRKTQVADPVPKKADRCLHEIFGVPPTSQLDCKQGHWKKLRAKLIDELKLSSGAGRSEDLLKLSPLLQKKQKNTSLFDPVLAHIACNWFSKPGDMVFDPFCGGSVRGLVALSLGRRYTGVDIRAEQIGENRAAVPEEHRKGKKIQFIHGDAADVDAPEHDLFFTCPPYLDLEKYSTLPGDLSTMSHEAFWGAYEKILKKGLEKLRAGRFAVIVVGDVRDKDGFYAGLPARTAEIFRSAGCGLYNDAVYLQEPATAAMRAFNSMNSSRKIPKAHQNFMVFCKGDPKKAAARLEEFKD